MPDAVLGGSGWLVGEISASRGSMGRGTFAQMKAITAAPGDGATYFVTNYPASKGSMWRYSSALADWFPTVPTKIYEGTALVSGVAQTAAQILLAVAIEANLLKGKVFRVLYTSAKSGTTDTMSPQVRMGAAGTTADATVAAVTAMGASSRSQGNESWFRMASATSTERLGGSGNASFAGASTSAVANAPTTVGDVTAANYVSIACTMSGTTDTPQVGYVAIELQP